ncbi:MAG: ribosome silencing factor [Parachlamydiaceae bacterium]|nr:ribosome silencing factor [Parachlamydiaceae bacterium]
MTNLDNKIINLVAQAIYDKKGFNILALDVRGISNMTDYFLIAEGTVGRHVQSLHLHIKEILFQEKLVPLQVEGLVDSEWVVMDYGDFVIHLFIPEMREKYAIEELWNQSKIVDLDIIVSKELTYPP